MVSGARALFGLRPKSARTSGEAPNVAFTYATYAAIWLRSAGVWAASATIFALVAAFESSTAVRRSMRVCRNASTCTGVSVAFATVSELTVAKCFFVPAISCFARATSVSLPVVIVLFLLSGPVHGGPEPSKTPAPCERPVGLEGMSLRDAPKFCLSSEIDGEAESLDDFASSWPLGRRRGVGRWPLRTSSIGRRSGDVATRLVPVLFFFQKSTMKPFSAAFRSLSLGYELQN